jgi:galactokinase
VAPGRANLIGEHTDYNEGLALPFAIGRYAVVAARRRSDQQLRLVSLQTGEASLPLSEVRAGAQHGWLAYVAGSIWAVDQASGGAGGLDLLLDSDVPLGAGLSSSAAVECAVVCARADLCGWSAPPEQLARLAQRAEVEMAGVPCGLMDQLSSMCGQAGHALLVDFRSTTFEPVCLPLDDQGLCLLIIDTRAPHRLVGGEYAERRAACQSAAARLGLRSLRDADSHQLDRAGLEPRELAAARHVVSENDRVRKAATALRGAMLRNVGPLLHDSHASLRDDFRVSVDELNVAAATAENSGALGARLMGGGFGGSVIALVGVDATHTVASAVARAFEQRGFAEPASFAVRPEAGARRLL